MARSAASRKYQVTINNPQKHGFTHEHIKGLLPQFSSLRYWCMCDETGEGGTPHTHLYLVFENAVMFSTLQRRFYGAHIEMANGSNQENRDYIRKEGRWLDDAKHETNHIETFEESGEMPPDRAKRERVNEQIYEMLKQDKSTVEIVDEFPSAMTKINYIEQMRQMLKNEKYKDTFRQLDTTYIYGETGVGKTRGIMEQYGYSNVYRVTDYAHPFDGYKGQDVLIFEEFRSSLPIKDMLVYLDGYPVALPCRYANKEACFTKVYILTNIPLEKQYCNIQREEPETWDAFCRRINHVQCMQPKESFVPIPDDVPTPWKE